MKARPTLVIGTVVAISLVIAVAIVINQRVVAVQTIIDDRLGEGTLVWEKIEQYTEDYGQPPDTIQDLHEALPLTEKQIALFGQDSEFLSAYSYDPESGVAILMLSSWYWSNQN